MTQSLKASLIVFVGVLYLISCTKKIHRFMMVRAKSLFIFPLLLITILKVCLRNTLWNLGLFSCKILCFLSLKRGKACTFLILKIP